jgi:hypothetical protein
MHREPWTPGGEWNNEAGSRRILDLSLEKKRIECDPVLSTAASRKLFLPPSLSERVSKDLEAVKICFSRD